MTGAKTKKWSGKGTASVVALRGMLAYARTRGVDVEAILGEIGVPSSALDDLDRRIPEGAWAHAWIAGAERSRDPFFGLHVLPQESIGSLDVLDYALYFSKTLGEAFHRLHRFHRVLCDAWTFAREVDGDVVRFRRIEKTPPPEAEAAFAFLVLRARELTGREVVPCEVTFAHGAPADTGPHAALFRCPVRFDCPSTQIAFTASDLDLPVRNANPGVGKILDRYMAEVLGRLPKDQSFVELVRAAVARSLRAANGGPPSLEATARELHASPRTVQRRLGEHGTTHAEVVDSVRRHLAERLIADQRMSITEVTFLLGFASVSGFRRNFKRWSGLSPSRARSRT